MDIFTDNCLYPEDSKPVSKHFASYFDAVYVALIPFFKLPKNAAASGRSKESKKIISLEEAQRENPNLSRLDPTKTRVIYASDESYPSDHEIYRGGNLVEWKEILTQTSITDYKELNKALMTSIGALRSEFQKPRALQTLKEYTENEGIFHPTEGAFDVFTKKRVYKLLKKFVKYQVVVTDEFYDEIKQLDITALDEVSFIDQIKFKDYYIYPQDKTFLFSISWDYFFFFIAINSQKVDPKDIEANFEGFWATEKDSHLWYW
ncbi:MAG TPA: DUF2711 family protein [Pseudosphingobacterium sp.]|nr:DUF2711 family protein [Pseudosphingobacterium sp.]